MCLKYTIIYDTYCGWCYGAAKALEALTQSDAAVEVLHRRLFHGRNAPRLADGFGRAAADMDARIGAMTDQPFSEAYYQNILMSKTEILDSGLTAQAAALVHDKGAQAELSLARWLQQARYVDGVSADDRDHIITALRLEGVSQESADRIGSAQLARQAELIAQRAEALQQKYGAAGVPTVLRHAAGKTELVDTAQFYARPAPETQRAS